MSAKTRREQYRQEFRKEIIKKAGALLIKEGYRNFNMRKLAQAVGYSPGSLYTYFKNKDELVYCLVKESFEDLLDALKKIEPVDDPIQHLKNLFFAYIDFGLANPDQYHFAFMMRRTDKLKETWKSPHRSFDVVRQTVSACVDKGHFVGVDVETASQGLWATVHGITSLFIANPTFPWIDKKTLIRHLVDRTIQGLSSSSTTNLGK